MNKKTMRGLAFAIAVAVGLPTTAAFAQRRVIGSDEAEEEKKEEKKDEKKEKKDGKVDKKDSKKTKKEIEAEKKKAAEEKKKAAANQLGGGGVRFSPQVKVRPHHQ